MKLRAGRMQIQDNVCCNLCLALSMFGLYCMLMGHLLFDVAILLTLGDAGKMPGEYSILTKDATPNMTIFTTLKKERAKPLYNRG